MIEFLMVIAVNALLMVILMPVIQISREQVKKSFFTGTTNGSDSTICKFASHPPTIGGNNGI